MSDSLGGQRKHVTILFADLVDSMTLAEKVDPEDWRELMDRFFAVLTGGVHAFEGTVDKFTGDGVMAIFGAPVALEDHAQRACLSALKLRDDMEVFAGDLKRDRGLEFSIRIGLNSGEVIVGTIGDEGDMAYTATGHTVGMAQRMESAAEPGGICVSPTTAELASGYARLGEGVVREVKGVGEVEVFELLGVDAAQAPIDIARARGLTPLVGRDEELAALEAAFEPERNQGQLIGIVGEPGVGKSRLCIEIAERCRSRGIAVLHVAAQAHAKRVPLLPVLTLLRSYFEIAETDSDSEARARVGAKLELLGEGLRDESTLLLEFLGIADPDQPVEQIDAEAKHRRLLALVRRLIHAQSAREPTLTIIDDLQWIDPASEAFMLAYVDAARTTRGLTLLSFRPDYSASWMSRSHYRQIPLSPLHTDHGRELVAGLVGPDPSLEYVRDLVGERSGGNPFFAEELVRSLAGSGSLVGEPGAYRLGSPVDEAEVPASVQAVLAARIDRLSPEARSVLEAAAVLGKVFPARLLARVTELADESLREHLDELVAAEFVDERALGWDPGYAFRHPQTQEVAYRSQLRKPREALHAAAAAASEEQYADQLDERSALIGHHWERGGEDLKAAGWFARAAAWSGNSNPAESVRSWRRVIELTDGVPESDEATALGLAGRVATIHWGWRLGLSSDDAERIFQQANEMALESGNQQLRLLLLGGYGAILGLGQGRIQEYARLAHEALDVAEEADDPSLCMPPNAYALLLTGELDAGLAALDRAIDAADGDPAFGAGIVFRCPYALCLSHKGQFLTMQGKLDAAREALEEGAAMAAAHGDLEAHWNSVVAQCRVEHLAGDPEATLMHAEASLELAERNGSSLSRAWSWTHVGMAAAMREDWDTAIEMIEHADEISRQGRTAVDGHPLRMANLAEAHSGAGDHARALQLAQLASTSAEDQGGPVAVIPAGLAIARVLLAAPGALHADRIERALMTVLEMVQRIGARGHEPEVRAELAELARRTGDTERAELERAEARRLFEEIGASHRVAALEGAAGVRR